LVLFSCYIAFSNQDWYLDTTNFPTSINWSFSLYLSLFLPHPHYISQIYLITVSLSRCLCLLGFLPNIFYNKYRTYLLRKILNLTSLYLLTGLFKDRLYNYFNDVSMKRLISMKRLMTDNRSNLCLGLLWICQFYISMQNLLNLTYIYPNRYKVTKVGCHTSSCY